MKKERFVFAVIIIILLLPLAGCISREDPGNGSVDYKVPDALQGLVEEQDKDYLLIDVRTAEEYASGHIPTSVNIPYDVIADMIPVTDKEALIIVYCRSGNRSGQAARTLRSLGYTNVQDFGAVSRWPAQLEY